MMSRSCKRNPRGRLWCGSTVVRSCTSRQRQCAAAGLAFPPPHRVLIPTLLSPRATLEPLHIGALHARIVRNARGTLVAARAAVWAFVLRWNAPRHKNCPCNASRHEPATDPWGIPLAPPRCHDTTKLSHREQRQPLGSALSPDRAAQPCRGCSASGLPCGPRCISATQKGWRQERFASEPSSNTLAIAVQEPRGSDAQA